MATPAPARWELRASSIPDDIALAIASYLEAVDLCSLGSCSRFWRELCASDTVWMALSLRRWPFLASSGSSGVTSPPSGTAGWKSFYISEHQKRSIGATSVIEFVEQCARNESLEVGYFLKAIGDLSSMEFGFEDVQMFFLTRKNSVLLNLIGLHYAILWLRIHPSDVYEALQRNHLSERRVCVSWFKLGRWFYGFRLKDESRSRQISLAELTIAEEGEVLRVLNRGAVHEVFRVQITSLSKP